MKNNVTAILIVTLAVAEPSASVETFDHTRGVVNAAISTSMGWQISHVVRLHVCKLVTVSLKVSVISIGALD